MLMLARAGRGGDGLGTSGQALPQTGMLKQGAQTTCREPGAIAWGAQRQLRVLSGRERARDIRDQQ